MPVYEWEGKTLKGETRKGTLKVDSEATLRANLRKDGIILLKAKAQKVPSKEKYNPKKKIKPMSVVIFTRQLSTMITSGLPLVQSLDILSNQMEDKDLKGIVREIKEKIETGSRFADALRDYPQCFDALYVNLVVAGEEGGMLDTVLQRLAVYMEKTEKLKKKVKSAMIYPISIIVVAIGVVMVLLIFVIPVFETMFKDMGATLPMPTQIVVNLSRLVKSKIIHMIVVVGAAVFMFKKYYKSEKGRKKIDALILKVPIFGVLAIKASVARVTRTLATLLSSGVPILESLIIVAKVAGNKIVEEALVTARARISEGRSMSEPLEESKVFPPMVVQMIEVGESTGALDNMLNKIADFYEEDVDNLVSNLTAMMEPMIMMFLGVVLGGLIIAMYLPIFKLGQAVG
ncbi:MAG TPA: type II secretion system F family protein [Syntrophorhabdaceae bacterium]|nr:type II secretion system F family protein [Syntrophorhabdaceae bacterium]HOL05398.1 type II secretion system F family protein [Syntrophorhabdaceae bacterium]HON85792.1 type II secretion system F family protein [Syntrophorhabdaceae bacterium]HOT42234.1 type II secretion system F family protein [Syntrophorhabdaceae bacterium]HPC67129.1 type II secretion system F family protein [Syntrophorhabdaceae bacterium]